MAATDNFRKQHGEMFEIVKRIEALLEPQKAAAFCAETKKLFAILADRIKRENTQLYPMADAATVNA